MQPSNSKDVRYGHGPPCVGRVFYKAHHSIPSPERYVWKGDVARFSFLHRGRQHGVYVLAVACKQYAIALKNCFGGRGVIICYCLLLLFAICFTVVTTVDWIFLGVAVIAVCLVIAAGLAAIACLLALVSMSRNQSATGVVIKHSHSTAAHTTHGYYSTTYERMLASSSAVSLP
jgi:hypothetical protein